MPEFFAVLILTPLAVVLLLGAVYITGIFLMFVASIIGEIDTATHHRMHRMGHVSPAGHPGHV